MQTNELWFVFKMLPKDYSFINWIYLIYWYEQDLALNNLQGLICHKTEPTNQSNVKQIFWPVYIPSWHIYTRNLSLSLSLSLLSLSLSLSVLSLSLSLSLSLIWSLVINYDSLPSLSYWHFAIAQWSEPWVLLGLWVRRKKERRFKGENGGKKERKNKRREKKDFF